MAEPLFRPGDQVRLRSSPEQAGTVTALPSRHQAQYWYPVQVHGLQRVQKFPEDDLEPYTLETDVSSIFLAGGFSGRDALSNLVTQLKLTTALRSQIYSLFASRTTFFPFQFKPLLKLLDSPKQRLLIADEVGLGKTIEAGLILTELRQRQPDISRILIVPPAHLCHKWRQEMRLRFSLHFDVLDSAGLRKFLSSYAENPSATTLWGIVSLQTLRSPKLMSQWEEVRPDLDFVIFDEAGRLRNPATRSSHVASVIGDSADAMLFLTATPVQTGDEDLYNLLHLLDPDGFQDYYVFKEQLEANEHVLAAARALRQLSPSAQVALSRLTSVENTPLKNRFTKNPLYADILARLEGGVPTSRRDSIELQRDLNTLGVFSHIINRTRKREVIASQPIRRARVVRRDSSQIEREFYDRVTSLCRAAYAREAGSTFMSFAVMTPQRQMASSMVAMVDYCKDRLHSRGLIDPGESSDLDLDDSVPVESLALGPRIDWQSLGNLDSWSRALEANDSKFEALLDAIRILSEEEPLAKIVLFTYFKKTIAYLQRRLAGEGIHSFVLTGDTKTNYEDPDCDERLTTIRRFQEEPRRALLLATEVADEGLDLQFAHCLINYDLPWNPMRIEQRIGRLDRIGQASPTIKIVTLSLADTIEDRILQRLYDRIQIFEQSVGDLEAILGEEITKLQRDLFARHLAPHEEEERITQTAETLERRSIELESFQINAQALLGQDEFYMEEIEQAARRGRYISGNELTIYVERFLASNFPTCVLAPTDPTTQSYKIDTPMNLVQFVRKHSPASDREVHRFLGKSIDGEFHFTISSEVAEKHPNIEFLTFFHPLIRAINRHYSDHSSLLHPVSHVRLSTDCVPNGTYVYFLYLTEITGLRPYRDLELIALHLDSSEVVDADSSELLLWQLTMESKNVAVRAQSPPEAQRFLDTAESLLVDRLDSKFQERKRTNDALVANRRSSLRETYERQCRIREERVSRARSLGRALPYIKGLETRVKSLEIPYLDRDLTLVNAGRVSRSYELRGAGLLEVK